MTLYPALQRYVEALLPAGPSLPPDRAERLDRLAAYGADRLGQETTARLVFICTHNSRRSQISQIWTTAVAAYFGLAGVESYSGGTEVTAFNPRAVAALARAGFQIEDPGGENPHYRVRYAPEAPALACFSKVYDDPANPEADFAAVMTCAQAEAACPFIPGATRIALPYQDPKEADGTPAEGARYDERVRQIGGELIYAMARMRERIA